MAPRWIKTALAIVGGLFLSVLVLLSMLIGVIFIPPELEARRIVREAQAEGRVDSRTWQEALPPRVGQAVVAVDFSGARGCFGATSRAATTLASMLTPDRYESHLQRSLTEMAVGRILDDRYSDDALIDEYARRVYFGRNSYGVDQAAQVWFGKPAAELSISEAALLAGLGRGPSNYDPARGPERAKRARERREMVLWKMRERGFINNRELEAARASPLGVIDPPPAAVK